MKVNVKPDGTVELDVSTGEGAAALDLIEAMQKRAQRQQVDRATRATGSAELNQPLYETWEYLCEHDSEYGLHIAGVARALGINDKACSYRLRTLRDMGFAEVVTRGKYRAVAK